MAEQHMLDNIRATFESYGFASIETPSVEELEVLLAKGETDKEIYTIERLQADDTVAGGESRLGLHYDLTVPFARYVAQHFNELVFPFKRYQMQRVWRGERPQAGRFREFTQCDVDVIGIDNLGRHLRRRAGGGGDAGAGRHARRAAERRAISIRQSDAAYQQPEDPERLSSGDLGVAAGRPRVGHPRHRRHRRRSVPTRL